MKITDHIVTDNASLQAALGSAIAEAVGGAIVILGVCLDRPGGRSFC